MIWLAQINGSYHSLNSVAFSFFQKYDLVIKQKTIEFNSVGVDLERISTNNGTASAQLFTEGPDNRKALPCARLA